MSKEELDFSSQDGVTLNRVITETNKRVRIIDEISKSSSTNANSSKKYCEFYDGGFCTAGAPETSDAKCLNKISCEVYQDRMEGLSS